MEKHNQMVLEKIRADQLAIHPLAQRELNPHYLKRLINKLNLDVLGAVHAVRYARNGEIKTWVVDGQHRIAALLNQGLGEWLMDVMVHTDVHDDAAAAKLFLELQFRLGVSPYDKYVNEVRSEDPIATGVEDLLTRFGLSVGRHPADHVLCCPVSLKKCYKHDNGASLKMSIDILTEAYGSEPPALEGKLIEGITMITSKNNGELDGGVLVEKLQNYAGGANGLVRDARGRMKYEAHLLLPKAIALTIVNIYNKNRQKNKIKV